MEAISAANPRLLRAPLVLTLAVSSAIVATTAAPPASPLRTPQGPALPRADALKVALPGQEPLLADFYWIQLLQQAGLARDAEHHRELYFWAELITDLDPFFLPAYQLAALLIPYNIGRESWVNGEESRRIIEKGLRVFPRDRPLRMYLAHDLMFLDRDYKRAADVLKELAQEPQTPAFVGQLATRLYAQAAEFDAGLEFARAMRDAATAPEEKAFFERRILEIESERVLQEIDGAALKFFQREGRQPATVFELLSKGDLRAPPVDPLGGEITIDAYGRARSSAARFRLELYEPSSKALAEPQE